ncbi:MAG: response regulator [Anaerolineae bacterium]|nr:response regulator [Anaerolineae bacterium]
MEPDFKDISVVVIENDPLNAALAAKLLRIVGVGSVVVCKAESVIPSALLDGGNHIDVILMDVCLSEADGLQLFEALKALPHLQDTRIIAATGHVMSAEVALAEAVGFHGFLGKPFDFDRFPVQLARILNGERVWEPL